MTLYMHRRWAKILAALGDEWRYTLDLSEELNMRGYIYGELARMLEAGLVECKQGDASRFDPSRRRVLYRATQAGQIWLAHHPKGELFVVTPALASVVGFLLALVAAIAGWLLEMVVRS